MPVIDLDETAIATIHRALDSAQEDIEIGGKTGLVLDVDMIEDARQQLNVRWVPDYLDGRADRNLS